MGYYFDLNIEYCYKINVYNHQIQEVDLADPFLLVKVSCWVSTHFKKLYLMAMVLVYA